MEREWCLVAVESSRRCRWGRGSGLPCSVALIRVLMNHWKVPGDLSTEALEVAHGTTGEMIIAR